MSADSKDSTMAHHQIGFPPTSGTSGEVVDILSETFTIYGFVGEKLVVTTMDEHGKFIDGSCVRIQHIAIDGEPDLVLRMKSSLFAAGIKNNDFVTRTASKTVALRVKFFKDATLIATMYGRLDHNAR